MLTAAKAVTAEFNDGPGLLVWFTVADPEGATADVDGF